MLAAELVDVGIFASTERYGDLSMHAVIDLARTFGHAELTRALERTIADFPVLGMRYEPRFFRDRWVPVRGPVGDAVVTASAPREPESLEALEAETLAWTRRALDPRRDRPIRLVSLERPGGGSRLVVSLLHLAVDGAGVAAVGHVLGSHLYGVTPSAPVTARRDLGHALAGLRFYHAPLLTRGLGHVLSQSVRAALAGPRTSTFPTRASREPTVRHLVIEAPELARLRARAPGASINDLLVAGLARAAARRIERGPAVVLYTMDLRRFAGRAALTATNTSSIMTTLVPREATRDLASATRAVAKATKLHQESLAGPAFLLLPMALAGGAPHALVRRFLPNLHPLVVDLPLARGLLVTNVGKIDHGLAAFGADVERVRIVGPNIERVGVPAVVAWGLGGALHLELYGAPCLAPEAVDELGRELHEGLELG
jgi:NRPS condensation-like uncharacterized protein